MISLKMPGASEELEVLIIGITLGTLWLTPVAGMASTPEQGDSGTVSASSQVTPRPTDRGLVDDLKALINLFLKGLPNLSSERKNYYHNKLTDAHSKQNTQAVQQIEAEATQEDQQVQALKKQHVSTGYFGFLPTSNGDFTVPSFTFDSMRLGPQPLSLTGHINAMTNGAQSALAVANDHVVNQWHLTASLSSFTDTDRTALSGATLNFRLGNIPVSLLADHQSVPLFTSQDGTTNGLWQPTLQVPVLTLPHVDYVGHYTATLTYTLTTEPDA